MLDAEPAPVGLPEAVSRRFGYNLYSCRYGNIYTARQLLQLWSEATGQFTPADPVWTRGDRHYDALRPNVEPDGLASHDMVLNHRQKHLGFVSSTFRSADIFVFTFGLTESWVHSESGTVYPTAPGTIAGEFSADAHAFKNFRHSEVLSDFLEFRRQMKEANPAIKFLVTVSPVPLTATATDQHVEVATSYSKAVLRAVCGELYESFDDVDYFPSYEIITSQNARGAYFEANKRSVSPAGVAAAMGAFAQAHAQGEAPAPAWVDQPAVSSARAPSAADNDDTGEEAICEDSLLDAFAK